MTKYNTCQLPNGLRIIHLPSTADVVYCGYQINAGSRDELPGEEGLAHFCEHITFKGTKRRSAHYILNALESVGGDLNAFTNKEDTVYYAAVLKEHTRKAVNVLSDIVFNSTYPQKEINKEVEVICDEIESYNDSPAELIYDDFENLIFSDNPLGHNILGSSDNVRQFTTGDALRFTRKFYRPENTIFFLSGDVNFNSLVKLVSRCTSHVTQATESAKHQEETIDLNNCPYNGQQIIRERGTHQVHVMIGTRAYGINHPRRISLYLLNNILGGPGMNARLNVALRERNALVYTVESSMVSYGNTGVWCTYFGCDGSDLNRCLRLVRKELDKVIVNGISAAQLKEAKRQLKGQIGVACDNRENFALDFGKSYLHYGWERDLTSLYEKIDKVTADDIQATAAELFVPEHMVRLIYK